MASAAQDPAAQYDLIKVHVWVEPKYEHCFVLSRFLVSRMLTLAKVPPSLATRVALQVKKFLVDNSLLAVPQRALQRLLFLYLANSGCGLPDLRRFQRISSFFSMRVPLMVLISGPPCSLRPSLAHALSSAMNMPNVQHADVLHHLLSKPAGPHGSRCSPDTQGGLPSQTPEHDAPNTAGSPAGSSKDSLGDLPPGIELYMQSCMLVMHALRADFNKTISSGKSVIIEGVYVDPALYLSQFSALQEPSSQTQVQLGPPDHGRVQAVLGRYTHLDIPVMVMLDAPRTVSSSCLRSVDKLEALEEQYRAVGWPTQDIDVKGACASTTGGEHQPGPGNRVLNSFSGVRLEPRLVAPADVTLHNCHVSALRARCEWYTSSRAQQQAAESQPFAHVDASSVAPPNAPPHGLKSERLQRWLCAEPDATVGLPCHHPEDEHQDTGGSPPRSPQAAAPRGACPAAGPPSDQQPDGLEAAPVPGVDESVGTARCSGRSTDAPFLAGEAAAERLTGFEHCWKLVEELELKWQNAATVAHSAECEDEEAKVDTPCTPIVVPMVVVSHACDAAFLRGQHSPRAPTLRTLTTCHEVDRVGSEQVRQPGFAAASSPLEAVGAGLDACNGNGRPGPWWEALDTHMREYAYVGVPVYEVHLGNVEEVLDAMHTHVLTCIETAFSVAPGAG